MWKLLEKIWDDCDGVMLFVLALLILGATSDRVHQLIGGEACACECAGCTGAHAEPELEG